MAIAPTFIAKDSGASGQVHVTGATPPAFMEILTPQALGFVANLAQRFEGRRQELLARREERQRALDAGERLDFLPETREIRESDWRIAPLPNDLQDRRTEITGPVDRKMVINALNAGTSCFMADFEDAHSPTWEGTIEGQINLRDAVRGTIELTTPEGKQYRLNEKTAVLIVRPRGWHLPEKHVLVDGAPISGSLFDFGLYFFHNAKALIEKGSGPYFYLPKMESHLEARLWNDVFVAAQEALGIPRGTIKATVLIETLPAAFEMDEILYELRDHSAGLNCGRWDYIFSMIKRMRRHPEFILPDRAQVTMTTHCMRSYSLLTIKTCHRRGAPAMGGMAAQIPIKNDPEANAAAMEKVRADKRREATDGHDGTWVAHPGLVAIAREEFDRAMPTPNQIDRQRDDVQVTAQDLLTPPTGQITEDGLRTNIRVAIQYIEAWIRGLGCVPLYNLMEDAATAEISRTQVWQWIHHPRGVLNTGEKVTTAMVRGLIEEELERIAGEIGRERFSGGRFPDAAAIFTCLVESEELAEFLTLYAYEYLD